MKEYKYILFDLDGTLTDPAVGITTCVAYALKKFGIEVSDITQLNHFIGPPLLESFTEHYGFDKRRQLNITESVSGSRGFMKTRFMTVYPKCLKN